MHKYKCTHNLQWFFISLQSHFSSLLLFPPNRILQPPFTSLSLSLQLDHQLSTSIQAFQHVDHYRLRSCSSTCRPWLSSTTVPRQTFVRIEFSPRLPSSSTTLCPCQKSWPEYLVNIPQVYCRSSRGPRSQSVNQPLASQSASFPMATGTSVVVTCPGRW